jgi:hypothetical protein
MRDQHVGPDIGDQVGYRSCGDSGGEHGERSTEDGRAGCGLGHPDGLVLGDRERDGHFPGVQGESAAGPQFRVVGCFMTARTDVGWPGALTTGFRSALSGVRVSTGRASRSPRPGGAAASSPGR